MALDFASLALNITSGISFLISGSLVGMTRTSIL